MTDLGTLVRRWQPGWATVRATGETIEARGALHTLIGEPTRQTEVVVVDQAALPALAAEVAASPHNDWLTVPTADPASVTAIVRAAGLDLLDRPECFMSTDLTTHPSHKPPADYTTTVTVRDTVIEARIDHTSGELAAKGTMVVMGTDAIAHDIATTRNHRRMGLASALMSALADEATSRGATTGLLIASTDGERLYNTLGWHRHATVLIAKKP